jgi:gliding motility-associated-like protein
MPRLSPIIILAVTCLIFFLPDQLHATHNRAGEITIEQVGDCVNSLTVMATIITYSKASSVSADRDSLEICWGDGRCEYVYRTNGPIVGGFRKGERLENDVKKNIYIAFHTFPARGTFSITMTDPNRNGGILNVNFPNSEMIRFHLKTTYTFPNPQFQGCNNTPVLLQPPIDIGCVGQPFIHNPNAFDSEGDSLSYEFIVPLQDVGLEVPNYQFPNNINPGPDNQLTIDEVTGDIVWDSPQRRGEYNLAMIIIEWRDGVVLDTMVRDIQILIEECENLPPEIETPADEFCVIAGDTLSFDVIATAPLEETDQLVELTALGGPFEVERSPAMLTPIDQDTFGPDPNIRRFTWIPDCDQISDQYYSVVFKAVDNYLGDTTGLATLKTVRIKVMGPPPENVIAAAGEDEIKVRWDKPYFCESAESDYFQYFTVWRREGSNNFPLDTCESGLAGRGYENMTPFGTLEMEDGSYVYNDLDVDKGKTYCYRIVAVFALTTPGGQYTYNPVEGLPTMEACVQLNQDLPIILRASVANTDTENGAIDVCWARPDPDNLDTISNPGPYRYEILRAEGITIDPADFEPIGVDFTTENFYDPLDTCYTDIGLNTTDQPYSYLVNFYTGFSQTEPIGATNPASSVYLNTSGTDQAIRLVWDEEVPWDNFAFVVFRQNDQGGFDSLATVNQLTYTDAGLVNGEEYCYRILALGTYGIESLPDTLFNFSQINCGVPRDDVPPCPPVLAVDDICDERIDCSDESLLQNTLEWSNSNVECPQTEDVAGYRIYYAENEGADFQLVGQTNDATATVFQHRPDMGIAGCYAVSAIDGNGNESDLSNFICVDNCPLYELPNTFTPNGDGQNDVFRPYPYCFIENVAFEVYNRWGQLVYETTDPDLNWDGTNLSNDPLPAGTYHYICRVFEQRVDGVQERPEVLRGFIELVRSGSE